MAKSNGKANGNGAVTNGNGVHYSSSASCATSSCARKWGVRVLLLAVFWGVCSVLERINATGRWFSMTPEGLKDCYESAMATAAAEGYAANATAVVPILLDNLDKKYPELKLNVDYQNPSEWVFNNAGGAMGSMFIIHASVTEYLIIFGSAIGTEGHTGRHTADDYFHIISGLQTAYPAGALVREEYHPGDINLMKRGVVKQYGMVPETWAMEYARGWIPLMLPFGFADMLSSTLDFITFYHTCRLTVRDMAANLLRGKF